MSSSSRRNTRRGRLCILINWIAGYVSIVVFYNSFFQLNRYFTIQWPPPRATPVIIPPQLWSNTSFTTPSPSMNLNTSSTTQASSISSQPGSVLARGKPCKVNSSLHKVVLERLEVQRAISEMGWKGLYDLYVFLCLMVFPRQQSKMSESAAHFTDVEPHLYYHYACCIRTRIIYISLLTRIR